MIKQQRGLTAITWVLLLGLIAIQVIMAVRIIPVYISYSSVKQIMDNLETDTSINTESPKRLRGIINKKLKSNSMYGLMQNKEAFKFSKVSGGTKVVAKYEERGPIFGNLNFVASFEYEVVATHRR